ncbi:hypothetical protein S1R3X_000017 [Vibrio phage vB_ValS_VA-RY-4]|nr:hypothetical protein S1R3X_000017 [Vibrio phage vB_ValS_VA-RY-4]
MSDHQVENYSAKAYDNTPERDFSSLETLARRRKVKGGLDFNKISPEKAREYGTYLYLGQRRLKSLSKTSLAVEAKKAQPKIWAKEGFVLGSFKVLEVTDSGTRANVVCVCGKEQQLTNSLLCSPNVCKHKTSRKTRHETAEAKIRNLALFRAWENINLECVARGVSMYPRWQNFLNFIYDVGQDWKPKLSLRRVFDPDLAPDEDPKYYRWTNTGFVKCINNVGFLTYETEQGKLVNLNAWCIDLGENLSVLSALIRDKNYTPRKLYSYLSGLEQSLIEDGVLNGSVQTAYN